MDQDTGNTKEMYIMEVIYYPKDEERQYTIHIELSDNQKNILENERTELRFHEFGSQLEVQYIQNDSMLWFTPHYTILRCNTLRALIEENATYAMQLFTIEPIMRPEARCTGLLHTLIVCDSRLSDVVQK
jgi:hypothetical protein